MTLEELSQLFYLNREIEMDRERLEKLVTEIQEDEEQLACLELKAAGSSSPNYDGMPKGTGHGNKIENAVARIWDLQETIKQKKALLSECKETIERKQMLCLAERNKLESYIAEITDSLLRLIFTYRFIDGLTWYEVSSRLGVRTTEESVKKMCYRYINRKKTGK